MGLTVAYDAQHPPILPEKECLFYYEETCTSLIELSEFINPEAVTSRIKAEGLIPPRIYDLEEWTIHACSGYDGWDNQTAAYSVRFSTRLKKTDERYEKDMENYKKNLLLWQNRMKVSYELRTKLFNEEVAALAKKYGF